MPSRAVPKLMSFASCETANVQRVLFRPRQRELYERFRQRGASCGALLRDVLLLIQSLATTGTRWTAFISLEMRCRFHAVMQRAPVVIAFAGPKHRLISGASAPNS